MQNPYHFVFKWAAVQYFMNDLIRVGACISTPVNPIGSLYVVPSAGNYLHCTVFSIGSSHLCAKCNDGKRRWSNEKKEPRIKYCPFRWLYMKATKPSLDYTVFRIVMRSSISICEKKWSSSKQATGNGRTITVRPFTRTTLDDSRRTNKAY